MEINADIVIDKLCEQIKQMSKAIAIKDALIEQLQEIIKQSTE